MNQTLLPMTLPPAADKTLSSSCDSKSGKSSRPCTPTLWDKLGQVELGQAP